MLGWPSGWRQKADERIFIRAVRSVSAAKMALLVPKGTQFFPDSMDRVSGNIDVWYVKVLKKSSNNLMSEEFMTKNSMNK